MGNIDIEKKDIRGKSGERKFCNKDERKREEGRRGAKNKKQRRERKMEKIKTGKRLVEMKRKKQHREGKDRIKRGACKEENRWKGR